MQSDAFPTPPIYSSYFQPKLMSSHPELEEASDRDFNHLLDKIELLMGECSTEESKSFWSATDRIKIKHRIFESMQKIENLFLDLARESSQDADLLDAVSESLLYKSKFLDPQPHIDIPNFLKQRA